jgi:hypothetical protein
VAAEWSVPKGRRICATCDRPFRPDEILWSTLRFDDARLVRVDRCPECRKSSPVDDAICHWKTIAPHPDRPKRSRLNTEAAGDLLKRLVDEDAAEHRALCYVLALGLVRRRKLKLTGSEPAPEPTEAELEAERVYREAVEARAAAQAEAEAAAATIPMPPPDPDSDPDPGSSDPGEEEDGLPAKPPSRPIGYLLLAERDSEELLRVAELVLSDDEIAAVTGDIRELFASDA